ncbi:MAG: hypothetical protein DMF41_11165 [Verrucomicrobia bacterium]|nr:MAG: hypothetical protein DMF41_11165 [Verrucomicrobiota bacterium]
MQLQRNEILTGLLVIGTIAVVAFLLVLLGAPGLFRPLVTYKIYFDNAAGIKQGAPVMLAGRKIGQVQKLYSPVSPEEEKRAQDADAAIHPPPPNASASPTPTPGKARFEDARSHRAGCGRGHQHDERPSADGPKSEPPHRRKLRADPRARAI